MPGAGRKGNLGLGTAGERLTTVQNGLMGCQALGTSRIRLRDGGMRVWECTLPRAGE